MLAQGYINAAYLFIASVPGGGAGYSLYSHATDDATQVPQTIRFFFFFVPGGARVIQCTRTPGRPPRRCFEFFN